MNSGMKRRKMEFNEGNEIGLAGKVQFLTDKTWDSFMADHSSVLVMMFAPCK